MIEPLVSSQWFVRTEGMGAKALAAVQQGDISILPERCVFPFIFLLPSFTCLVHLVTLSPTVAFVAVCGDCCFHVWLLDRLVLVIFVCWH